MSTPIDKSSLAGERAKLVTAIDFNRDQSLLRLMRAMIDLGEVIKRDGNATMIAHAAGVIEALNSARLASAPGNPTFQHPDDSAVDRFAAAMKFKMEASRAKGRGGWDNEALCSIGQLQTMLCDHLKKGDPVDVGNLAMMLWNRGGWTAAPVAQPLAPSGAVPVGYLPAYQLNRLASGHDANLRSAKFGPSPLDGDIPVYLAAQPLAGQDVRAVTEWQFPSFTDWLAVSRSSPYSLAEYAEAAFAAARRPADPSPVNPKQEQA